MLKAIFYSVILCGAMTMMACGDAEMDSQVDGILALSGDAAAGAPLYASNCAGCHGEDGKGGSFDEAVTGSSENKVASIVLSGDGSMPSYQDKLSDQEIANIIAHINKL